MRTRKMNKNDGGFSLVEVVVGMMILSIVIVSVLAMFTQSSKANLKSRLVQGAETLLGNLVEYVETGRAEVVSDEGVYYPLDVDFSKSFSYMQAASSQNPTETEDDTTVIEYTYNNVGSGFNKYKVKVTKDIAPSDYSGDEYNDYEIINIGDSTNCSMLFDMCAGANNYDSEALSFFRGLHQDYLSKLNDTRSADGKELIKVPEYDGVTEYNFSKYNPSNPEANLNATFTGGERTKVARKIFVNIEKKNDGKCFVVNAGFRYVLDNDVAIEDSSKRTRDYVIQTSVLFNSNNQSSGPYLENLYFLYRPTDFSGTNNNLGLNIFDYDIIYEGDGINLIGAKNGTKGHANFFIAYQENSLANVEEVAGKKLSERTNKDKTVKIKFDDTSAAAVEIDVYCSSKIEQASGGAQFKNLYAHKLIATQKSKRIISYNIVIMDTDGNKIVEQKTTCMVNK